MQQADIDAYWAKLDTPAKSIKSSLQSLAIFAGYPDSLIDPTVDLIRRAFEAHRHKDDCRKAVMTALEIQPHVMIKPIDLNSTADWIMAGLRNSHHLK